eukprot:TRINITY_DN3196_c0_g1_i1.p1 TRINITY_DN3196_c0_g1~~TRINITY_DN3196_c0_g1_i1.p1  ORF type:complete len:254 (-),score=59.32 TRINITY_DN3196_c0_g1_i1:30-677(-)
MEENAQNFRDLVLPKDPFPADVFNSFTELSIQPFFVHDGSWRYYTLRIHVVSAGLLGWMFILQATPYIRRRFIGFHRFIGWMTVPLMLTHFVVNAYVYFVIGIVPVGDWAIRMTIISYVVSLICYPLALFYVKAKNIAAHRSMMLLTIASMFLVPVQRFIEIVTCSNNIGGPYHTWEYFRDYVLAASAIAALLINYSVSRYYALQQPMFVKQKHV